jgi:antitoxin CptB
MTGTQRSSADLDVRRRKILFRSWHRGIREMDLILGQFADAHVGDLTDAELDVYEALIEAPDRDIFSWLTDAAPTPANYDTDVFRRVKAFHTHLRPIHV